MAADLLEETGWSAASTSHNYTALIGEFGGTPHLVGLAVAEAGDHLVLVAPSALRSALASAEEYVSHSVRLSRVRDRLVGTRTKVPVIFVEIPAATAADVEAFDDYDGEEFVPFCQRFRRSLPLASDVLRAYGGAPLESDEVEEAPEVGVVAAPGESGGEVADLLRALTSQPSDNFGAIQRRLEALEGETRGGPAASGGVGTPRPTPFLPVDQEVRENDVHQAQAEARAALLGSREGRGGLGASSSAAPRGVRPARGTAGPVASGRGAAASAAEEAAPGLAPGIQALALLLQKLSSGEVDEDAGALASSAEDYAHLGLRGGGGHLGAHQMERLHLSREARPSVVIESHQKEIEKDLGVLPGEAWSYGRHARERVLPQAPGYHGLRKCIAILAHALDLHRTKGADHGHAFLCQAYKRPRPPLATPKSSGPSDGLFWGSRTRTALRGRPSLRPRQRRWQLGTETTRP